MSQNTDASRADPSPRCSTSETPTRSASRSRARKPRGGSRRARSRAPAEREAAELAPLDWARKFLPHFFTDEPAAFHRELLDDLASENRRLVARVAPRGHAKSTCASFAYPLWCLCARRKRNIVIITHESSLATQFLRDIRNELETNEQIRDAYGDLSASRTAPETDESAVRESRDAPRDAAAVPRRRKWAEAVFTAANGVSVQARGSGAGLRGVRVGADRPDLIICDDIEKDEHVASPEGRRKLEHWLRRVVMPALAPHGQLLVLGSLLHYDSLLANLSDPSRFPRWDYRVYRSLESSRLPAASSEWINTQNEAPPAPNEVARGDTSCDRFVALWPARWPVARLFEERERIGTLTFEQEYQAHPVDDSTRVFRPEWLRRYDERELDPARLVNLIAVDPATGATDGDYFALWAGSLDTTTGVIYTRELKLERIGFVAQVQRIVAAFRRWNPVRIGIETNAYQIALKQSLDELGRTQGLYLPVVALPAHGPKLVRIEAVAPFFENGTFRFPMVLDPEAESQFLHFPRAKHDDAPDVCAMAIALARTLSTGISFEFLAPREGGRFTARDRQARKFVAGAW